MTTTRIGGSHYALVAALIDDGLQIINITDPENPLPAAHVTDGVRLIPSLNGAYSVTTAQIGTKHYALVAATEDHGIQIIDITDPVKPLAGSSPSPTAQTIQSFVGCPR